MYLLESLVVHEAGCILGYVELPLLYVLAELPTAPVSAICVLSWRKTLEAMKKQTYMVAYDQESF